MKKITYLKTLLVGLCAMVATSAWADDTTIYEKGTDGHEWATSDLEDWVLDGTAESSIEATGLQFAKTAAARTEYTYTKSLSTSKGTIVSMDLAWTVTLANGSATAGCYFTIGDVTLFWCGQNRDLKITIGGSESTLISGGATSLRGTTFNVSLLINKGTKAVSYSISNSAYNSGTAIEGNGYVNSEDVTSIVFGWWRGGQQNISSQIINSIVIKEEEQTISTANYTVKYLCGETIVKEESNRSGEVGKNITLLDTDKASVMKDNQKYIYVSDDSEGKTIADGVVVTVSFREATKYHYVLNAVNASEEVIKTLGEGEQFEGEKGYLRGVKAFYKDDILYSTDAVGGFEKEFTEEETKTITYLENTDWAYFTEVEDMNISHSWAADGGYPELYSNGRAVRFYKNAYAYTAPFAEGGTYKVTMWARNNSGSSSANVGLYYRDADGILVSVDKAFEDWATGKREEHSVEGVAIPAGCSFVIKNENADYNSNLELDYIFFEKTSSEAPAIPDRKATIGTNGFATFASAYNISLPTGVKAYTAKVNEEGTRVNFTEITSGTIPANNGVLLEGAMGEISLTVVDSATELGENDFNVGRGKALSATENTTYFALVKDSSPLTFGQIAASVAIPANKAYLAVVGNSEARLTVTFDGETTAIKSIENAETSNAIYNLNGQRVEKAQKGLYIVNGKKTIVK